VVTVRPTAARTFEIVLGDAARRVGFVTRDPRLRLTGLDGSVVAEADLADLKRAWKRPLSFEEVSR
jgi:hypothetical protein